MLVVVYALSHVWLFVTPLQHARLLHPRDFSGKTTRVGCHFFLQGIFQIQGLKLQLLHRQMDSLPLSQLGSSDIPTKIVNLALMMSGTYQWILPIQSYVALSHQYHESFNIHSSIYSSFPAHRSSKFIYFSSRVNVDSMAYYLSCTSDPFMWLLGKTDPKPYTMLFHLSEEVVWGEKMYVLEFLGRFPHLCILF